MKITDYPQATELASDDSFIIDGPTNGTRHIPKENLPWGEGGSGSVPATDPVWVSHRNTYRGKSLGSVYTEEQKEMVRNNTFDDIYIGDYWTIGGFDWLVADINYWLNTGGTSTENIVVKNHLLIVPKTILYTSKFNNSSSINGGYVNSDIRKTGLNDATNMINTAFGTSNILSHKERLSNAYTSPNVTGSTWVDSTVDLMNQIMIYGNNIFTASYHTIDKTQLSLFSLRPDLIPIGEPYWLRDFISGSLIANVSKEGCADDNITSHSYGVRPVFGLTG